MEEKFIGAMARQSAPCLYQSLLGMANPHHSSQALQSMGMGGQITMRTAPRLGVVKLQPGQLWAALVRAGSLRRLA